MQVLIAVGNCALEATLNNINKRTCYTPDEYRYEWVTKAENEQHLIECSRSDIDQRDQ